MNPFRAFKNWLLDREPRKDGEPRLVRTADLFEKKLPWQTEAYYTVYRFFKWNWIFHPTKWYYSTKYFIQRGSRGWAVRDTWSLDNYIDSWMPEALEHLKAHKHGFPCMVYTEEEAQLTMCWVEPNTEAEKKAKTASEAASARWNDILDKMIAGFKASRRIQDSLYEEELGDYPMYRPEGITKEAWDDIKHDRLTKSRALEDRDEKLRVEGMTLFVQYYHCLWD